MIVAFKSTESIFSSMLNQSGAISRWNSCARYQGQEDIPLLLSEDIRSTGLDEVVRSRACLQVQVWKFRSLLHVFPYSGSVLLIEHVLQYIEADVPLNVH